MLKENSIFQFLKNYHVDELLFIDLADLCCPLQGILHLVVWYSGPGQTVNHQLEEENQALINLERNIANLERSFSASQLGKSDTPGPNEVRRLTGPSVEILEMILSVSARQ